MRSFTLTILITLLALPFSVDAHGGRTNADGCHTESATGEYHCHNNDTKTAKTEAKTTARTEARTTARDYNCDDFIDWEKAQDTYEHAGGPLIDPYDLDRDSDGIACETLQ